MSEFPISGKVEAKISERSVDKLIDAVVDTFSPASETLGALGDGVRLARVEIAARITRRAKEIGDANGLKLAAPPLKFLAPFYERASIEDEGGAEIEEMWANLLVSAASDYASVKVGYVNILASLSRDEANLMKTLFSAKSYGLQERLEALDIAEFIDRNMLKLGADQFFEAPSSLGKQVDEFFDVPGNLLWFAGDGASESECYGVDPRASRLELPEVFHRDEYLIQIIMLLISKGLLREIEFEHRTATHYYTVLVYSATPLAISFMNEVQPGDH
ncbi:MAG: hypothetical protein ACFE0P_07125 [Oceanicaulis sp.]